MRYLFIYANPVLGDFLHIMFPYIFNFTLTHPTALIDFTCIRNPAVKQLAQKMDIMSYTENTDRTYDSVVCLGPPDMHLAFPGEFKNITYLSKKGGRVCEYIKNITDTTFAKILAYFRRIFYTETEETPGIIINIGSTCHNGNPINNNDLFQDRIADVIQKHPNEKFTLVGRSHELVNQKLRLLTPSVELYLDKTENILDLVALLFKCRLVIVRNTGIMHLAGLCNCDIISLNTHHSVLSQVRLAFGGLQNINVHQAGRSAEGAHPFYHEKWSPLSDNIVDIVEYKKNNSHYNGSIPGIISHYIVNPFAVKFEFEFTVRKAANRRVLKLNPYTRHTGHTVLPRDPVIANE